MAKHKKIYTQHGPGAVKPGPLWWLAQLMFTGLACFFLYFGISLLIASYQLPNPFSFIMTFFGACLMILISAVMAMGFIMRMRRALLADPVSHQDDLDQ
jgi:hypothetical protein